MSEGKAKQYILMTDEITMMMISKMIPSIVFLEVQGMNMQGDSEHMLLVTPVAKSTPTVNPCTGNVIE